MPKSTVAQSAPKSKKGATITTLPQSLESALLAMNEEFCIVDAFPAVVAIPSAADPELRIYSRAEVSQLLCADRIVEGTSVASRWFTWKPRRRVKSLTYAPGKPRFFDNKLNTWIPGAIKPIKGDISVFTRYLDHIFASDSTFRNWFVAWLAFQFQRPGVKIHSAVVFWSPETATGKSRFGYLMAELFGEHNFAEINEGEMHGRFNFWADRKQFVMGEEIKGSNSERAADFIKTLISRKKVNIDTKNTKQYTIPDCINYFFTSNRPQAFHLDSTDRRFFVHRLAGTKLGKLSSEITTWASSGGLSALLYYLQNEVDLSLPVLNNEPFNPYGDAPQTTARREMIDAGRDESEVWLDDFAESPLPGYGLASAEELYALFIAVYSRSKIGPRAFANSCSKRFPRAYSGNALRCSDLSRKRLFICDLSLKDECEVGSSVSLSTLYDEFVTQRS